MGYKPLNRPNNFMLGSKPWYPAIYDENITPLEQMNKLAEKLNEIIGDDTNVKNDVEKLLGVWKDAFMAKAGYVPAIETIYSENPLKGNITGYVVVDGKEKDYELIEGKYVYFDDRYKPISLMCSTENKNDGSFYFCNMVWEYWNGKTYTPYQNNNNVWTSISKIYLPTKGDSFKYRVKMQDEKYTAYAYINVMVTTAIYAETLSIEPTNASLVVGDEIKITARIEPENTSDKTLYWSCDNNNCIVENGTVTAIHEGRCNIFCRTKNGIVANCSITINTLKSYTGEYIITPKVKPIILDTDNSILTDDINIKAIPKEQVPNSSGGNTVYIGKELERS